MPGLFRQEVIERQINRLHGDVLVLPRISHSLVLAILLAWLSIAVCWLLSANYARKETVLGWLEPDEGLTRIYPERAGTVRRLLAREGQFVEQGQPLLIVQGDRYLADGEPLEQQMLDEYEGQRKILYGQLQRGRAMFQRRRKDLLRRIEAAKRDIVLLSGQLETVDQRHGIAREAVQRKRTLREQGYIASTDLENSINQELALRHERQALRREELTRRNALAQLRTDLELLPREHANEAAQLRTRLSDLAQKIAQLQGQRAYVIKAPRPGRVNNLQTREGERIGGEGNVPLLSILPEGQVLRARLLVPVRSAGFLERGQTLEIRFDAFPYQKFGLHRGEITEISDVVMLPNELPHAPMQVQQPVYPVTARLEKASIEAYGRELPLKAGMTLSADVRLAERSLLRWLLEPLYSLKGRL